MFEYVTEKALNTSSRTLRQELQLNTHTCIMLVCGHANVHHACMCTRMRVIYAWMRTHTYVHTHVHVNTQTHMCTNTAMHTQAFAYAHRTIRQLLKTIESTLKTNYTDICTREIYTERRELTTTTTLNCFEN